jgi:energy-converting hydrogenase Eha subunit E
MRPIFLLFIFAFCFLTIVKCQETKQDTTTVKKKVEISFGQSLLFASYSKSLNVLTQAAIVIPTSSILIFAVFRPIKRLHIPLFCNIPTESKQYLINGVLTNERANPTIGTGVELKMFDVKLAAAAKIEFNIAALGTSLLTKTRKFVFAPMSAFRLRIVQNNNFVMYLGTSYSYGINTWGIIFGTGYIF